MKEPIRVYADTSVFGGVFDEEFSEPSRRFFELVKQGRFVLVVSPVVRRELDHAPERVKRLLEAAEPMAEHVALTAEALSLQAAYLADRVVSERFSNDALHVAIATVSRCTMIVSWNFKHIVHFERIPLYNAVNTREGHLPLAIYSPREVIENEDEGQDI